MSLGVTPLGVIPLGTLPVAAAAATGVAIFRRRITQRNNNVSELRKYGVLLTAAKSIQFTLYQIDGVDIEPAATFSAGDVKISKDGGAEANVTNLPTDNGQGYSIVLTAAELTAARARLFIVDQTATKVWLDIEIDINTHGHANAMFITDFDEVMRGTDSALLAANINLTGGVLDEVASVTGHTPQTADHTAGIADIPTVSEFNARTLAAADYFDPAADAVANVTLVATTTTNTDMRGTDGANTTAPDNTSISAILTDTADMQPKLGTPAADISADIAAVKVDTAATLIDTSEIGAAGAGLTNLGGMSTAMKAEVNVEADTALTDYDGPTNTEMELRTPTAAQLSYIVSNSADGKPVTFTGGTTTTAILGNVDGVAASSTDDAYNGRILIFNAGTLDEQGTDITAYNGTTKTATITAVTTQVTSSHTANLK